MAALRAVSILWRPTNSCGDRGKFVATYVPMPHYSRQARSGSGRPRGALDGNSTPIQSIGWPSRVSCVAAPIGRANAHGLTAVVTFTEDASLRDVNHLAVWLLVLAQQAIGFIWYSPALFGDLWLRLQGKTAGDVDASNLAPFVIAIAAAAAMTYFYAWLLRRLAVKSVGGALRLAALIWVSVSFLEFAMHYAFLGLPIGVLLIDMGKSLLGVSLVAVVLVSWPRRAGAR